MSKETLTANQFALVEQTLREKITSWTNEVNNLNGQIENAKSTLEMLRTLSIGGPEQGKSTSDEKFETIVQIFRDARQRWIATGYVRQQYLNKTGKELPQSTLRLYLKGNEVIKFEKRGDKRLTKWKMIEKD